ncbi:ParB/RepB/Spo0J family partition protein [Candidatus Kaiserbacteria bacterium]|nr:ParB/RepB/Spo0J family partition protein [Candidatus Kaiserbacteria bacterium]
MSFQGDSIFWVDIEKIVPNPYQPRREFNESKLSELADSIRMYGILQPLTVTRKEVQRDDGTFYTEYELIAGERRMRASQVAGITQVPVIIRDGEQTDQEKLELAIIENLQREDLNAIDRALAFRQLADVFGLSHTQVAKKVGRSREYVSNSIRLLALPDYMQSSLKQGDINEGHARTLLMLNDRPEEQDTVFREILLKKLSVREVERIARKIATDKVRKKSWHDTDPELMEIEKKFTESLGTRVQIQKTDYGGKVTIDYFSQDDLDQMLELITKRREFEGNKLAKSESGNEADILTEKTPLEVVSNETEQSESSVDSDTSDTPVKLAEAESEPSVEDISRPVKNWHTETNPVNSTETPAEVPPMPPPLPQHKPADFTTDSTPLDIKPVNQTNENLLVNTEVEKEVDTENNFTEDKDDDLYSVRNFTV